MPLVLLLLFAAPVIAASEPSLHEIFPAGDYDITTAEFHLVENDVPPVDGDWQTVELPHLWSRELPTERQGWYRFRLSDDAPTEQLAVYFWRFSMNLSVWLNDQFLGDGGSFEEPIGRNWNRPFLFLLPASAWEPAGDNYLYVRLAVYPGWGNLAPIVIAPHDEIKADYDRRYLWQISFSQATWFISIITALVAFTFWMTDRASSMYGIFALVCLAWSLYSLNNFIQEIPCSAKTWWWALHSAVDWYGVTLTLFGHRLLGLHRPVMDRVLISFGIIATLTYAAVDLWTLSRINSTLHLVTLGMAAYLMVTAAWYSWKNRSGEAMTLLACLLVVVFFGIHDLSMNAMVAVELWRTQFFWLQFSAPVLMLTMLVLLSRRFVISAQLRVDAEQRIQEERERVYADVHDDVGGRVLSLVYASENEQQAGMARETLQEIRAIVRGANSARESFPELVDYWQAEAQERCEQAGIELDWRTTLEGSSDYHESTRYHVQRILRELITNAIKHAEAKNLTVMVASNHPRLNVMVEDDGHSGDALFEAGTGIANIQRRVNELGGEVSWDAGSGGCRVTFTMQEETA